MVRGNLQNVNEEYIVFNQKRGIFKFRNLFE